MGLPRSEDLRGTHLKWTGLKTIAFLFVLVSVLVVLVFRLFLGAGWWSSVLLSATLMFGTLLIFVLTWRWRSEHSVIQNIQATLLLGLFAVVPFLANYVIDSQREIKADSRVLEERKIAKDREKEETFNSAANQIPRILQQIRVIERDRLWLSVRSRQVSDMEDFLKFDALLPKGELPDVKADLIDNLGRDRGRVSEDFLASQSAMAKEPNYLAVCSLIRARFGSQRVDQEVTLLADLFDQLTEIDLDTKQLEDCRVRFQESLKSIQNSSTRPEGGMPAGPDVSRWQMHMERAFADAQDLMRYLEPKPRPDNWGEDMMSPDPSDQRAETQLLRLYKRRKEYFDNWHKEEPNMSKDENFVAIHYPLIRRESLLQERVANGLIDSIARAIDITYVRMLVEMEVELLQQDEK